MECTGVEILCIWGSALCTNSAPQLGAFCSLCIFPVKFEALVERTRLF